MTKSILIASYLEPEHVEQIRRVDGGVEVMYMPELLWPPQYPADHRGQKVTGVKEVEPARATG